ncbi:hypothetical protein [Rheinheimera salexigens]|uniref:Uncharacterized protein n=1 Tax=Rheinheimera salexigens TaxID=1628148 RepID=A0A1E7Q868_9GAMM|nr:hypothetical protein [Rheinheimera salexigens]OEY70327.1 hypothetical protein BI198_12670 [Rheinheimera salexigens]
MLRTDLKIFKSERMTQQSDAGGQRTANEVQNGQLNEVFGNISDIDHAQSAVDIAKIYPAVSTANTDLLQDGHILINEPPLDPLVDVMIVEANGVNDGSTRADIVEAIESSVVASLLLRSGMSGFVAGQDQISDVDLQQNNAGPGEQKIVQLGIGRVYALAVEYTGNESDEWPRFQHFIKITETGSGYYRFEPPIPRATPGRDKNVNGQIRCTVLRDTTVGAGVIYHGVTQLTASATGSELQVSKTAGRVTPQLQQGFERLNNVPFAKTEEGLLRKNITLPAIGAAYEVEITDFFAISSVDFIVSYVSNNRAFNDYVNANALTGTTLSFTTARMPDTGSTITISYFSSERYQNYNNASAIPGGYTLLFKTIEGTVFDGSRSQRYSITKRLPNEILVFEVTPSGQEYRQAATLDLITGEPSYVNNHSALQYTAILENNAASGESATSCYFAIPFDNVIADSFYVSVALVAGGLLSASGDSSGNITGVSVTGAISGNIVNLTFAEPVKLSTLKYNINELVDLVPPTNLYGINPLRLPKGGAVQLFRTYGVICLAHNQYEQYPSLTPAQTLTRRPNSFIDIVDSTGASLWHPLSTHYEYDKATGEVTIVDVTGFTAPYELIDTLSELTLVTGVTGSTLKIRAPLVGSFPAGSIVSSVYQLGDLQARTTNMFDQNIWDGTWADVIKGDPATANYNAINYPIEVANQSAVNERWAIIFTSDTAFRCVGKNVGQVASGDILNDFSPINPATNQPFFIIRSSGWGGGWQPGNVLRFNTVAASKPAVLLRSVSAGHSAIEQDSIRLHFRGNAE